MEKFCRYCGCRLDNGLCTNPTCEAATRREEYAETVRKRPISLQERRRLLEAKEAENNQTWIPVEENGSVSYEHRGTAFVSEEQETAYDEDQEEQETRDTDLFSDSPVVRFLPFLSAYYREPGRVVKVAAVKQDVSMGVILIIASVCLSLLGTLIFGAVFLEDFLYRWVVVGGFVPLLAYGVALAFGQLYVYLSPAGRERRAGDREDHVTFREVFTVVTVSGVFPNLLLLLSCVISPLDESMQIFQSFALLLTVAWILCLMLSLFTVYGGGFSMAGLLLTVGFGLLAFSGMRSVWVWYLTGEFDFALLVPLSVFLTGH